jgi:Flp pilus assembly protein TadD
MLGVAEQGLGRTEQAVTAYRRAAKLDEQAWRPRNNLAVLLGKGDLQGALAAAQEAYALAPTEPDVLDTLGWLYLEAGRADRSIQLLEDARRAAPASAETGLHLALAYRAAGRNDDARRLLETLRDGADGAQRAQVEDALRSLP